VNDVDYMRQALSLAAIANGRPSPNPMVGALIVANHRVVGQGAHLFAGTPHAEVHALRMAGTEAFGATVYVSLEPCSHYGRTPPCATALIDAKVGKVVVAMIDPDPRVAGRGVHALRNAGIEVEVGVLEQEACRLNEYYVHALRTGLPFVTIKSAMTLDGKIACHTGDSRWVSGAESRLAVHRLRDRVDAVLTGVGTVVADDPLLTVRLEKDGRNPVRVIVDSRLRAPLSSRVYDVSEARTIVMCTEQAPSNARAELTARGVEIVVCSDHCGRVNLKEVLTYLATNGILSVLVEAGPHLTGSLMDQGLVQRVMEFISPKLIGGTAPSPLAGVGVSRMADAVELRNIRLESYGMDFCIIGDV